MKRIVFLLLALGILSACSAPEGFTRSSDPIFETGKLAVILPQEAVLGMALDGSESLFFDARISERGHLVTVVPDTQTDAATVDASEAQLGWVKTYELSDSPGFYVAEMVSPKEDSEVGQFLLRRADGGFDILDFPGKKVIAQATIPGLIPSADTNAHVVNSRAALEAFFKKAISLETAGEIEFTPMSILVADRRNPQSVKNLIAGLEVKHRELRDAKRAERVAEAQKITDEEREAKHQSQFDEWTHHFSVDPITDEPEQYLVTSSDTYEGPEGVVKIQAECRPERYSDQFRIFVSWPFSPLKAYETDGWQGARMISRFDKNPPAESVWWVSYTDSNVTALTPGFNADADWSDVEDRKDLSGVTRKISVGLSHRNFFGEMSGAKRLVLRTFDASGNAATAIFKLDGYANARKMLLPECQ